MQILENEDKSTVRVQSRGNNTIALKNYDSLSTPKNL
jgi:hypothetical protein